jgi:hypothetical protein
VELLDDGRGSHLYVATRQPVVQHHKNERGGSRSEKRERKRGETRGRSKKEVREGGRKEGREDIHYVQA